MGFWAVVFVVLMILCLAGGGGYYNNVAAGTGRYFWAGSFFLLWLCVAILGYIVLAGGGAMPVR